MWKYKVTKMINSFKKTKTKNLQCKAVKRFNKKIEWNSQRRDRKISSISASLSWLTRSKRRQLFTKFCYVTCVWGKRHIYAKIIASWSHQASSIKWLSWQSGSWHKKTHPHHLFFCVTVENESEDYNRQRVFWLFVNFFTQQQSFT